MRQTCLGLWFTIGIATSCPLITTARAGVPPYAEFELQARGSFTDGYSLPPRSFFTNSTADLSDSGYVAIHLIDVGGSLNHGVWLGGSGTGSVVHELTGGELMGDVSVNDAGYVAWQQYFGNDGIWLYDPTAGSPERIVGMGGFYGLTGFGDPIITNENVVGFRGKSGSAQMYIGDDHGTQWRPVAEVGADSSSPYSYLFSPAFNELRQFAGKARRGALGQWDESQPDEIRVWNPDGSSVLIAVDRDSDAGSPYARFDNSVALNDSGDVAFIATLVSGGRGVFVGDGTTTVTITTTTDPEISDIEFFHPALNNSGWVAFRAFDESGFRAVFVGDRESLVRVATEHDVVPSDLGDARIDQHDDSPVFGGNVSINACGDVTFQCGLAPPDNPYIEWGSAVYVRYGTLFGDLDGDREVGLSDLATMLGGYGWIVGPDYFDGDLDGDGYVDLGDLAALLAVYERTCP